jgi:hypothetical protein
MEPWDRERVRRQAPLQRLVEEEAECRRAVGRSAVELSVGLISPEMVLLQPIRQFAEVVGRDLFDGSSRARDTSLPASGPACKILDDREKIELLR